MSKGMWELAINTIIIGIFDKLTEVNQNPISSLAMKAG